MKSFSSSPFHLHQRKLGISQCVPNWDLDDTAAASTTFPAQPHSDVLSTVPDHPMLDYEVAELTWENGQLAMHGLGLPRTVAKPASRSAWEKPRAAGTLESIVDLATCPPPPSKVTDDLLPWFDHPTTTRPAMDTLVPCSNIPSSAGSYQARASGQEPTHGTRMVGPSTVVGSCSGAVSEKGEEGAGADAAAAVGRKRMRVARAATHEGSGRESRQVTMDTCEMDMDVGFTSTSPENTSFGQPISSRTKTTTVDDHDSVCLTRTQRRDEMGSEDETKGKTEKSTVSTKRSRAAALHNQSERERRDRINQRMKTLQRLVPNASKTDKASVLDEVIEYLKQLQGQVQMMTKLSSISQMMMPMSMQQLQMSMMAQCMGMGMGVVDMNSVNRFGPPAAAIPPMIHPAAFLPATASWDGSVDRLPQSGGAVFPDPFSAFLACQAQQQQQQQQPQPQLPMTLDACNRLAALYQQQQLQQQPQQPTPPGGKT